MSTPPFEYRTVDMTDEEFHAEQVVYGELTGKLRGLNEAVLRTTVAPESIEKAQRLIEEATALLDSERIPEDNFGVVVTSTGRVRGYGNAVVGLRNALAVPVTVVQDREEGSASAEFYLNGLYEGPPGRVHGGVSALILDQVFGEACAAGGPPGMTGTLTLRYRRPTLLGQCSAKAWVDRRDGIKTIVKGWLKDAEGTVCVEAEGLFIVPKWARAELGLDGAAPPRYE